MPKYYNDSVCFIFVSLCTYVDFMSYIIIHNSLWLVQFKIINNVYRLVYYTVDGNHDLPTKLTPALMHHSAVCYSILYIVFAYKLLWYISSIIILVIIIITVYNLEQVLGWWMHWPVLNIHVTLNTTILTYCLA